MDSFPEAHFSQKIPAAAVYLRAEVHRLRGEFAQADAAYRDVSQCGEDAQPGLALLRLMQGQVAAASAAIRVALSTTTDRLERVRLLPAYIEIMIASTDVSEARAASNELEATARQFRTDILSAIATNARGAVELAEGNARAALGSLREAWQVWRKFDAPYMAARARVLMGLACDALGDSDGHEIELCAARSVFVRLGAAADLARVDFLLQTELPDATMGLTQRELKVLQLITAAQSNKTIATKLSLSDKTVHRHVSNIFVKLGVTSRVAATAFAYRHQLIDLNKE